MAEQESNQIVYTSTVVDQSKFTNVSEDNNKTLSDLHTLKTKEQKTVKVYVKFATDTDTQPGYLLIGEKYYLDSDGTLGKITDE